MRVERESVTKGACKVKQRLASAKAYAAPETGLDVLEEVQGRGENHKVDLFGRVIGTALRLNLSHDLALFELRVRLQVWLKALANALCELEFAKLQTRCFPVALFARFWLLARLCCLFAVAPLKIIFEFDCHLHRLNNKPHINLLLVAGSSFRKYRVQVQLSCAAEVPRHKFGHLPVSWKHLIGCKCRFAQDYTLEPGVAPLGI